MSQPMMGCRWARWVDGMSGVLEYSAPMTITLRLFAIVRDRVGRPEVALELPEEATVAAAAEALAKQHPAVKDFLRRVAYAVNREYVPPTTRLRDGDEVAIIPPVSGG